MENPKFVTIVTKLSARKQGLQWLAKCPAHDDRQASLSLNQSNDGTILLKCFAGCSTERIIETIGFNMSDLFVPKQTSQKQPKEIAATYEYQDENGKLLFQAVRYNPKGFNQRRPDGQGGWIYNLKETRRVLYRLPELLKANARATVFICEGEKDVDRLRDLGLVATTNPMGAGKWRDDYATFLQGREVVILPDNDDPGRDHAEVVAKSLKKHVASVKTLALPGLPVKGDVSDWLNAGGDAEQLCMLAENASEWTPRPDTEKSEEKKAPAKSKRTDIVEMVQDKAELFHDADMKPYAVIKINEHVETYPITSQLFRIWMSGLYFRATGAALTSDTEKEALRTIQSIALYDGKESEVFLRLAGFDNKIYLDLTDRDWRVVEISAEGWKVIPSADSPVKFVRRLAMLPLPEPVEGGKLDELRNYMNAGDDDTWILIASWLAMTFHPNGPYPILSVCGEQGSAKSTTCKILRSLIDPNRADLRAAPKDERDLMIAASNSWVMAFDNLSGMTQELSDSLCRVATGAGFSTRALHTNDEETIFCVKRPILANGIATNNQYSDWLDRAVSIYLRAISKEKRKDEATVWTGFHQTKPRILGALLSGVSHALKQKSSVHLARLPRMADFALWAVAAEEGIGLSKGSFWRAYEGNQESSNDAALDSSPAIELREFLESLTTNQWTGTSTDLFNALKLMLANKGENYKDKYGFPKGPSAMGVRVRRIAPNLRAKGWDIECGETNKASKIVIRKLPREI